MIRTFASGWIVILWVSTLSVSPASAEQWAKVESSGVVIEYEEGLRDLAGQILPEIVKKLQEKPPVKSSQLDILDSKKQEILSYLASELAMDKPGENMVKVFDKALPTIRKALLILPTFDRYRLWRRETLKQKLQQGEKVPGFTYHSDSGKLEFNIDIVVSSSGGDSGTAIPVLPLVVKEDPQKKPLDQLRSQVTNYFQMTDQVPGPAIIIREAVQAGLILDLKMKDQGLRWFTEGMANYTAAKCLEKFFSSSESKYFLAIFDTTSHQPMKAQLDLSVWPESDKGKPQPDPQQEMLRDAFRAFATEEIISFVKRQNPQILTSVLKELTKTSPPTSSALLSSIKKASGEDFSGVLKRYSEK